jgi:Domain of unknown function (DUF1906)
MALGLDYSYSHPNLECARREGYEFVARYIGDPDPNSAKYLDGPELAAIKAAGLSVVVVRETTAGFMITDDGGAHARVSRAHCNALGLWGIPIYYALDVDPRGLSTGQRAAVKRFLHDAAMADGGGASVGIYGSDDALDMFLSDDCHWAWQTYAWSTGRVHPRAHFRQYKNGANVCGGTVDLNVSYAADFGQWPRPGAGPIPTPPPPSSTPQKKDDGMILIHGPGNIVSLAGPGYWRELEGDEWYALDPRVSGLRMLDVDQRGHDLWRSACLYGNYSGSGHE